jgi:hypothetical protein
MTVRSGISYYRTPRKETATSTSRTHPIVAIGPDRNLSSPIAAEAHRIGYVLAVGCDRRTSTDAGPVRADVLACPAGPGSGCPPVPALRAELERLSGGAIDAPTAGQRRRGRHSG